MKHFEKGASILDVFGSVDGEGLAWLRSDLVKNKEICLLRGENVDIVSKEISLDVKLVDNLTLKDVERYDFIISARPLYLNRSHEYFGIGQIINLLYKRLHWNRLVCLLAREASSLWYSRVKVSETQTDTKSESLYMFKEMRHLGVSLALDSLRLLSIDVELRAHIDYLFIKAQGITGLPADLTFLYYNYFNPFFLQKMKPYEFALVCSTGELAAGHFPYHEWHKLPKENIVAKVGLKIEYGREIEQPKDMGTYKSVGDSEHMQIILLYAEGNGYAKMHEKLNRSNKTLSDHIHKHNNSVIRSGFCAPCRRGGGKYSGKIIKKGCSIQ